MVSPATESKKAADANAATAAKEEDAMAKAQDEAQAKEDAMFQALLNSQREILAKLDFGGSNSDMQFVEGPDNLPLVSPQNSGAFDLCNSSEEYDYRYEQYPGVRPPKTHSSHYQSYHRQQQPQYHQQRYHNYQQQQQPYHQGFEQVNVDGIGDDRFILEEIEIASSDGTEDKGPATFDVGSMDASMTRRKRDMEEEMVQTVKKRRNGSNHGAHDSLLPSMDESSSSLDFASLHSTTESSMWKPRRMNDNSHNDHNASESTLKTENKPEMEDDSTKQPHQEEEERRPAPPGRSSRNLWKPRQRRSSELSVEEKRSMWKPRNRSSTPSQDSATSLDVHDLDASTPAEEPKTMHVSIGEGDLKRQCPSRTSSAGSVPSMAPVFQRRCPSRSSSNDSTTSVASMSRVFQRRCPSRSSSNDSAASSVHSLSEALQQSVGSTKSIQEWDKKMGLKRSHSKTMRQSAKSREQLLTFLQKEQQQQQQQAECALPIPQTIAVETIQEEESNLVVEL